MKNKLELHCFSFGFNVNSAISLTVCTHDKIQKQKICF